jgi:(R,R)-butanediol dehydrogenase/meso-butanediol dehydrogenase/diacetyl reductase
MKALRWFGRLDLRLTDVEVREPGPVEVVVRVGFCGICGTDLEEFTNGPILIPLRQHPLTGASAPITLGHEFAGIVAAVGEAVSDISVGDRIVPEVCLFCGKCTYCRAGMPALCENWAAVGLQADGGLAEYVTLPAASCSRIPTGIDDRQAALAEPLEVAVRAVRKAGIEKGARVLVVGAGPIGLLVTQVVRSLGADRIIVLEPRPARGRLAARLGADAVLGDGDARSASRVIDALGGPGADAAIECVGRPESIQIATESVRKRGRIVLVGLPTDRTDLNLLPLITGERQLVGTIQHQHDDLVDALALLASGEVRIDELVTDVLPLSSSPSVFDRLATSPGESIKVLIDTQA